MPGPVVCTVAPVRARKPVVWAKPTTWVVWTPSVLATRRWAWVRLVPGVRSTCQSTGIPFDASCVMRALLAAKNAPSDAETATVRATPRIV